MKKQSQDQTNEQLHIDDAAAAQEEYSLEDIMNEFGGWSKKEEAAPKQQAQTPPDLKKPPQKVPESAKPAPETVRWASSRPISRTLARATRWRRISPALRRKTFTSM